ncbi:hypothetical protein VKT23_011862 [Stygiomarasmius scandens]|uniref:Uncharacterized protein n=1 Tax=Marasmiellus scandens TaxID=2682957 RepID=A0ABR1J860_9AGAR
MGSASKSYSLLQHLIHGYKAAGMDSTAVDSESLCSFITRIDPDIVHHAKRPVLLHALGPLVEKFNEAKEEEDFSIAFRALYDNIKCPFGRKPVISVRSIESIAYSYYQKSAAGSLDLESLQSNVHGVFLHSEAVEYSSREYLGMHLKEVQHLFNPGEDYVWAFQVLFEKLGYDINESEHHDPDETSHHYEEVIGALKESMAEPFRGSSAYALSEYLTDCHQRFATGSFYARFLSICNSSGTGKTRAILELRNFDIPVLYINMRPSSDRENFPPSDNDMVWLFWPGSYSSADDYYHACLKIFCAVFELLGLEFSKPDQNLDEMISSWNEKYTEDVSINNGNRPEFFKKVRNLFGQMRGNCSDSKRRLLEAYKRLCQHLKSPGRFLVLALDESHVITQAKGIGYSPSYVLGRAIADFTSRMNGPAVWVLFCSTNSEIAHFVAPAPFYNSAGVAEDGQLLFAPFSYLEWDVYAECGDELDVLSVGEFKTMICFGRPLWKSVLKLHTDPSSMTEYALDKLLSPQGEYGPGERACLALLSQRFALDIALDDYHAESFVINGIASHMRYLVSTSENCMRQYSIYPSEPVLSHAAAVYMYQSPDNLNNLLSTLRRQISSGLIQAGELGELLGRLLILISRDFAAIRVYDIAVEEKPIIPEKYLQYSEPFPSKPGLEYFAYLKPVPLLLVLCILFGNDNDWIKGNCKKAFERAYVSASHWVRRDEDVALSQSNITKEEWLKDLFLRGIAIQCRHEQPMIDALWPIL